MKLLLLATLAVVALAENEDNQPSISAKPVVIRLPTRGQRYRPKITRVERPIPTNVEPPRAKPVDVTANVEKPNPNPRTPPVRSLPSLPIEKPLTASVNRPIQIPLSPPTPPPNYNSFSAQGFPKLSPQQAQQATQSIQKVLELAGLTGEPRLPGNPALIPTDQGPDSDEITLIPGFESLLKNADLGPFNEFAKNLDIGKLAGTLLGGAVQAQAGIPPATGNPAASPSFVSGPPSPFQQSLGTGGPQSFGGAHSFGGPQNFGLPQGFGTGTNTPTGFGTGGAPAFPSFGSGSFGTGAPPGSNPVAGGLSPNFPLPANTNPQNAGIQGVLGSVAKQLLRTSGLGDILQGGTPGLPFLAGIRRSIGGSGPPVLGIPRIPGIPLLPGGIPKNAAGQIDVLPLISALTRRVTNGSSLSDLLPPDRLQSLADNVTEVLLPETPELDLSKFMGRWFEGINSPRATEQRCVVHHYGGLTENGKTATFTALKIYREGSEFGQVRYSIGYAFRGGHRGSMLQMHSSEATEPAPYWIYKVGPEGKDPFGNPQYEYAVVSNWVKYPVMVLVRDPDTFKEKYEVEVLRWLEDNLFINPFIRAFNMLQPASYENCQYSDSTFEVFGR